MINKLGLVEQRLGRMPYRPSDERDSSAQEQSSTALPHPSGTWTGQHRLITTSDQ